MLSDAIKPRTREHIWNTTDGVEQYLRFIRRCIWLMLYILGGKNTVLRESLLDESLGMNTNADVKEIIVIMVFDNFQR